MTRQYQPDLIYILDLEWYRYVAAGSASKVFVNNYHTFVSKGEPWCEVHREVVHTPNL